MKINIKDLILEEGILDNLAKIGATTHSTNDTSSRMNSRADKINPISDPNIRMGMATNFKADQGQMELNKNHRDFITGSKQGTQASAQDLFNAKRMRDLNNLR